ncbi:MAG: gamma-glutamylcyclotransferase [Rubrobacteraceae bacterium]
MLKLFVYGTLKRGFANHDRFCAGALDVEEASTRGNVYDLPFGFPALVVPPESVRALGTTDYTLDAAEQRRLDAPGRLPDSDEARAYGEVFTFEDPEYRLPGLDHLEGYTPGGRSLYRRVLLPVETSTGSILAWAYAVEKPTGTHLPGGSWPS